MILLYCFIEILLGLTIGGKRDRERERKRERERERERERKRKHVSERDWVR